MGPKPSEKKSSADSKESELDLELPEVTAANGPVRHPEPPPALVHAHAMELVKGVSEEVWEKRRAMMCAERFEW